MVIWYRNAYAARHQITRRTDMPAAYRVSPGCHAVNISVIKLTSNSTNHHHHKQGGNTNRAFHGHSNFSCCRNPTRTTHSWRPTCTFMKISGSSQQGCVQPPTPSGLSRPVKLPSGHNVRSSTTSTTNMYTAAIQSFHWNRGMVLVGLTHHQLHRHPGGERCFILKRLLYTPGFEL